MNTMQNDINEVVERDRRRLSEADNAFLYRNQGLTENVNDDQLKQLQLLKQFGVDVELSVDESLDECLERYKIETLQAKIHKPINKEFFNTGIIARKQGNSFALYQDGVKMVGDNKKHLIGRLSGDTISFYEGNAPKTVQLGTKSKRPALALNLHTSKSGKLMGFAKLDGSDWVENGMQYLAFEIDKGKYKGSFRFVQVVQDFC